MSVYSIEQGLGGLIVLFCLSLDGISLLQLCCCPTIKIKTRKKVACTPSKSLWDTLYIRWRQSRFYRSLGEETSGRENLPSVIVKTANVHTARLISKVGFEPVPSGETANIHTARLISKVGFEPGPSGERLGLYPLQSEWLFEVKTRRERQIQPSKIHFVSPLRCHPPGGYIKPSRIVYIRPERPLKMCSRNN